MIDDRVAGVAQAEKRVGQQLDVREMQARGRLVEHVERAAGGLARKLGRELHALRFAARQRGRGLAELNVAEADLAKRDQPLADARDRLEQLVGLVDREIERVGDRQPAVADLERLAVVALAAHASQVT